MGLLLIAAGMFWFYIINQSGNALLTGQSEEVTMSLEFQVVDIPH